MQDVELPIHPKLAARNAARAPNPPFVEVPSYGPTSRPVSPPMAQHDHFDARASHPPFSRTPTPPRVRHQYSSNRRFDARHRSPARGRRNYRDDNRDRRHYHARSPPRSGRSSTPTYFPAPQRPARCGVHVRFDQINRSAFFLMDTTQRISDLLYACCQEWHVDANENTVLFFDDVLRCPVQLLLGQFLEPGQTSPKHSFFFYPRRFRSDVQSSTPPNVPPPAAPPQSAPSPAFTWLGPSSSAPNTRSSPTARVAPPTSKATHCRPKQNSPSRKRARSTSPRPVGKASVPSPSAPIPPPPAAKRSLSEEISHEAEMADVRMFSPSDVEMEDVGPPVRTEAEKARYAAAQRAERDRIIEQLEDIWQVLRSAPRPQANLLNKADFDARIWSHLCKGPTFPALARRVGLAAAAKHARHQHRKNGHSFTYGEELLFNDLMNYNRQVLESTIPGTAQPSGVQSSRRSHLL